MEEYLFRIVQNVTLVVKPFPFVYAAIHLLYWLLAPMFSNGVISTVDSLIYLSAVMVLFLILLSYCIKLCKWHRLQCVLVSLPQLSVFVDENIYKFGDKGATVNYSITAIIFILSLINGYLVFKRPAVRK